MLPARPNIPSVNVLDDSMTDANVVALEADGLAAEGQQVRPRFLLGAEGLARRTPLIITPARYSP